MAASLARLRPSRKLPSVRLVAAVLGIISAIALGIAVAGLVDGGDGGVSSRVVEEFGDAPVAVTPAPASSPLPPPQVTGGELAAPPAVPAPAAAVPVRSGRIGELSAAIRAEPVRLEIAGLGLAAPVGSVGYDARRREMEVPRSPGEVGWYRFGASPGQPGSAVLAAHVDFNGVAGAFYDLHQLEAGDAVVVLMDDGSRQRWEVVARRQYGKELLPTDAIFARDGDPFLALITCGGPFDGRRYEDNVVVFARPEGAAATEPGPA